MKVVELLKLGAETLKTMSRNGIFVDDWKYVEAYEHLLPLLPVKVIAVSNSKFH